MTTFKTLVFQNEYLPIGATEVHAVVAVTATGAPEPAPPPAAAEVILIDVSGSMAGTKLASAKAAAAAAVDCLRDGVTFAIVAGAREATEVYPGGGELVAATERTRLAAKEAIAALTAGGGTAIGTWLTLAKHLVEPHAQAIRHAILLTDGRNGESAATLEAAIDACEGHFQCDCRGVGTDWKVAELRQVASALLGEVGLVADPAGLESDFRALMEHSMTRLTNDVALSVWIPRAASVVLLKQVSPTLEDLTARGTPGGERTVEFPTGAWGQETREYHLCVRVPEHATRDRMLAARVGLVVNGAPAGGEPGMVKATWTDNELLSAQINPEVAHYTGQAELAGAIQTGIDALDSGDFVRASRRLGDAVRIATHSSAHATLELLGRVVDVDDAAAGVVRLKDSIDLEDAMSLTVLSVRTVPLDPVTS